MIYFIESWILYRGLESGVSDIVRDAYRHYGDMEFGGRVKRKDTNTWVADIKTSISHVERHVKLIRIAWKQGEEDNFEVNRGKHVCRFLRQLKLCLFLIYVLYVPLEK